jgi:hypothetical protein
MAPSGRPTKTAASTKSFLGSPALLRLKRVLGLKDEVHQALPESEVAPPLEILDEGVVHLFCGAFLGHD